MPQHSGFSYLPLEIAIESLGMSFQHSKMFPFFWALLLTVPIVWGLLRYPIGLTLDGMVYLSAARSLQDERRLVVPVTQWDEAAPDYLLRYHPPGYPLLLAGIAEVTGLDLEASAKALNISAFLLLSYFVLRYTRESWLAIATAVVLLFSKPFFLIFRITLAEPAFLLMLGLSFLLAMRLLETRSPRRVGVYWGLAAAVTTYLRYAGLFLVPALFVTWLCAEREQRSAPRFLWALLTYLVLVTPWFLYLGLAGFPPRHLGLFIDQSFMRELSVGLATLGRWLFYDFHSSVLGVMALALLSFAAILPKWFSQSQRMLAGWTLVYLVFLLAVKTTADPNVPFDPRLLAPGYLLFALFLIDLTRSRRIKEKPWAVLLTALFVLAAVRATYVAEHMHPEESPETILFNRELTKYLPEWKVLARLPPEVNIYTNRPYVANYWLKRPIRRTPLMSQRSRLPSFKEQVESTKSVVVIFYDARRNYGFHRDEYWRLLRGGRWETFDTSLMYLSAGL